MNRFLKLAVLAASNSSSANAKHGPLVAHRRKPGVPVAFADHVGSTDPWLESTPHPIEVRWMLDIGTGNSPFANMQPHDQIYLLTLNMVNHNVCVGATYGRI